VEKQDKINRRRFLKGIGAAGLGSFIAVSNKVVAQNDVSKQIHEQEPKYPQVPKRKLGKAGIMVPCLSLGVNYSLIDKQILLRKAFDWGVNYWDTAPNYGGGNSELGIGKFISKYPEARKNLFIATKATDAGTVEDVEKLLQTSLERMNTKYIDLYYGVTKLSDPAQLTDELKKWSKSAKERGLIRFFGFATHKNMPQNLAAASKLDWIDAIMTIYNYRFVQDKQMQEAIDACYQAGIGLIAMKTIALTLQGLYKMHGLRPKSERNQEVEEVEKEDDKKLVDHFLKRDFTEEQAKIKVVLEDKRFSSVCVGMMNVAYLTSGVAAALDKTKLTQADRDVLKEYAQSTSTDYCAGCANICESAVQQVPYISDIMRYLMYYNSYDDKDRAKKLFAQIPSEFRSRLLSVDYSQAEAACPQQIPIGRLVAEAVKKLA
jgi:aryl-alcohol dehydrogenase-like predicted oxidoreductase